MADGERRYTVDDALLATGFGKYQYLILFYAGMGWVSEAMEMMLLSFVGPAVQDEWGLTSQQDSLITSVVFAGMLIGAYSWGLVSDRFGRRRGFLVPATVTSAAGLFSAFAPNYAALITARFFVGLGVGGGHVLVSWFLEFIPATNRGTWMVIFSAFWTVGTIFEAGLAWYIMPRLGWRWLLGLCSLPSFLLLVFYPRTPESPRYLCFKGKKNSAVKILEKIAELNGKELPLGILASDHEIEMKRNLPREDGNVLSVGEHAQAPAPPSKWKDSNMGPLKLLITLLSRKLMRSTLLLWIVFFGNAFSYYGLVLLTTELNKGNGGCNSQSKKSDDVNYKEVFVTSCAEFPGLILSAFIVDKLGRKISMAGMFFLGCIAMLPLVVHQSQILTTVCLFGARICITGTFTVVYIYAPEIYPTSVRSTGLGVASSMGRIGGMLCPLVAVSLVQGCQQTAAVSLFIGIIFASGIAVLLFPFETNGRQLVDSVCSTKNDKEHETEDLPMPPLFQFLTVMAFKIFVCELVDVAIIEVGLGGQKDSTNVINEPVVCGITSLGMDHTEVLGDTLGQIALHKAGIFKHQIPAFTAPQLSEAMDVLRERAQDLQVPLKVAEPLDVSKFGGLKLSLLGDHQFTNAGVAVSLCKSWLERTGNWNEAFKNETGLPEAFCRGLSTAHLSGRGQIVHDYFSDSHSSAQPVERSSGGLVFYLDGAHSPESMEACAKWFSSTVQGNKQRSPSFSPTSYVGQSVKHSGRNGCIQRESERSKDSDELSKKILLFNCMEVRDPEVLLPRLVSTCASSGTYFSKAIFVPSMSTYSKVTSGQSAIPHDFTRKDLSWQINLQRIWERIIHGRDIDGLLDKNRKLCRDILPPQDFLHEDASHCSSAERYFSCSTVLPSLPLTIKWLRDCARENPSVTIQVLVTGSLHLVGDVLKILRR